ncbi:MAG: tetratricopeptide repeat protein, partial [Pirellulaceae bacterium]|nr:tetratricopeptide repeat protein [Pirellulaceae bacterium]
VLRQRKADDPEILLLLAQCQTGEKDYDGARKSYERVIEKAPGKLDAYVNLAYLIREHSEALGDIEDAAREGSTEKVADVEPSEGENPDAVPAEDEKTPDAATAGQAAKHDDEAATPERKADDWMNLLVERNPETAEAYVLRGEYLRRTERLDEAEKDSAKALELMPDDKGVLMLAIGLAMDKKNFDAARAHAQHAVELFAQEPDMFEVLGNIERRAGSPEKAREWIDKGLAVTGDSPQLLWSKAVLLIELGDLENARPVIDRLRESRSAYAENIRINYLEGRLALAEKEWAKARSLFESIHATVRERSPGMAREIAIYLRESYLKLNRGDLVAAMEREIRGAATTQAAMGAESIQQLLATGQIGRAIGAYRELLKRDDVPPEAWIDFSKLLLVRDSRIPKEQRDFTEFQGAIDKAAELNPDRPEIPVLRANMLLVQGQPAEARDLLHQAVTKSPGQWALWEQLLLLAHNEKEWTQAAELLDEAEKHIEAKASVYMARARLAVARDAEKASAEIKQIATKGDGMVDSERVFFLNQLGGYALQARDFNLAKELYRKAADSDRSNLEIRLKLFETARLAKDTEAMKQCLGEIRGIEGEGPHWHYFSAALLSGSESDTESLEQAIDHLAKARLMRPEWAEVPMLLATIQEQMGNPAAALESYREAVRQGSRNVVGMGRFSQLLVRQNQQEEAARIIGLMKEMNVPLSPDAEYLLVVQSFREGKEEEGVAQLKEMADELRKAAATSKDYRDSARLSGVLRQLAALAAQRKDEDEARELLDEAETAIRRSVELEPENARLWMLLVAFLNQTERVGRVGDVLSEAQRKLPAAKAAITLAQCYEILGRMAEAEQQYDRAATEAKDDETLARLMATFFLRIENPEKQSKGEAILREMVDGTRPTSEADAAWARRRLALSLSQKGDHKSYLEAMKLIDANLAGDAASIPDKRIKARLLAHRPNRADRATARAIFEELVRIPDPSPSDRYELARLLFVEQEWNEASRQMQPLLAGDDIQPEWLDFYIRAQIRAGELRDAESNLKRYERIAKDPFMVTIILARIQSGRGRHDLAIRTVKEYVDNASPTGVPRANRALNAGRALTNLAKHVTGPGRDAAIVQYLKQAEQYFREYVTKDPSQARILIGFLGEQGNREEALELAEDASNADP